MSAWAAALTAITALALLAAATLALLWRADSAIRRRQVAKLRQRIRDQRAEHARDLDEWRQECSRLTTWAQDQADRLAAATVQRDGYRHQLETSTVGADTEADDAAAMQRDLIRIARLPEYRAEDGGEVR